MIKQGLPNVNKHKVVVLTITYNHAKYIEDTLKGFAMQQTDFPFLCCVFDDASTDGEQAVLKRWVENQCNSDEVEVYDSPLTIILKAPDKNNPNCIYVIHLQKINTWGKPEKRELLDHWIQFGDYLALCEGDDYWIDSFKLQKQVDYLENNTRCKMCYTDFNIKYEESGVIKQACFENFPTEYPKYFKLEDFIVRTGYMCPPSWLYSLDLMTNDTGVSVDGTFVRFSYFLSKTEVHCIDDVTCVYRVLPESASHSKDPYKMITRHKELLELKKTLIKKYSLSDSLVDKCISKYYKDVLMLLVVTDNIIEVDQYRAFKCDKSFKDRLILLLARTKCGLWILKNAYRLYRSRVI